MERMNSNKTKWKPTNRKTGDDDRPNRYNDIQKWYIMRQSLTLSSLLSSSFSLLLWLTHSCWPGVSSYLFWPSNDWMNELSNISSFHWSGSSSSNQSEIVHTQNGSIKECQANNAIESIWLCIYYIHIYVCLLPLLPPLRHRHQEHNTKW